MKTSSKTRQVQALKSNPGLGLFRRNYRDIKNSLPWLDVSVRENEAPAFPHALPIQTDYAKAKPADPTLTDVLARLQSEGQVQLLRLTPDLFPLTSCAPLLDRMQQLGIPLVILHTDMGFEDLRQLAQTRPALKIILESGPRKLIYHYSQVKEILRSCPNFYLSTYNFCNWHGHEELVKLGLTHKLLYGSHMPLYAADAAMAPIILGGFDWQIKCDIAGNNLRRLLGLPARYPPAIKQDTPIPFIIDAHAHNLQPGAGDVYKLPHMPTPDVAYTPDHWLRDLDALAFEQLYLIPGEALFDPSITCQAYTAELRRHAPQRFFYMEIFNPHGDAAHFERVRQSLTDPACVAIKIHPTTHQLAADDEAYAKIYDLAAETRKPIMTHSWEISDYNPEQFKAHPDRFRKYLPRLQKTSFVLGHAGGRPSAFEATVQVCRDFPQVHIDLAGDYFHNGMVDAFVEAVGAERVIFATDVNWFDPRCELGIVLGSNQTDAALMQILRTNALRVFRGFPWVERNYY